MKQKKGKKPGPKRLVQGYLLFTAAYIDVYKRQS